MAGTKGNAKTIGALVVSRSSSPSTQHIKANVQKKQSPQQSTSVSSKSI